MPFRKLISVALIVLLWASVAEAWDRDPEARCNRQKARASADLFQCLVEADINASRPLHTPWAEWLAELCVAQHIRGYAAAEAQAERRGADCSDRDELRMRQSVAAEAANVVDGSASPMACAAVNYNPESALVTCQLTVPAESTTVSSVEFEKILSQLEMFQVDGNTVVWIQVWGAEAGKGAGNSLNQGGNAGEGGYAQTITTLGELQSNMATDVLYFYLGQYGTHNSNSGGQGGAATIVTTQDLTQDPTADPDASKIVLIAGGGGGGGGMETDGCYSPPPAHDGGSGGIAFATTAAPGSGPGADGGGSNGGTGGDTGQGGTGPSHNGHDGYGGRGGDGGKSGLGMTDWVNTGATTLSFSAGEGAAGDDLQNKSCVAGGGGGGYAHHDSGPGSGGGGGGASFAITSTQIDGRAPDAAGGLPSAPNGATGFVQLTFDLAPDS